MYVAMYVHMLIEYTLNFYLVSSNDIINLYLTYPDRIKQKKLQIFLSSLHA